MDFNILNSITGTMIVISSDIIAYRVDVTAASLSAFVLSPDAASSLTGKKI